MARSSRRKNLKRKCFIARAAPMNGQLSHDGARDRDFLLCNVALCRALPLEPLYPLRITWHESWDRGVFIALLVARELLLAALGFHAEFGNRRETYWGHK